MCTDVAPQLTSSALSLLSSFFSGSLSEPAKDDPLVDFLLYRDVSEKDLTGLFSSAGRSCSVSSPSLTFSKVCDREKCKKPQSQWPFWNDKVPFQFQSKKGCVKVCVCYLHGDQCLVNSLFLHQLAVSPQLYDCTFLESSDDISVSDGWQAVGHNDGGTTLPDLHAKIWQDVSVFVSAIRKRWPATCSVRSWGLELNSIISMIIHDNDSVLMFLVWWYSAMEFTLNTKSCSKKTFFLILWKRGCNRHIKIMFNLHFKFIRPNKITLNTRKPRWAVLYDYIIFIWYASSTIFCHVTCR